MAGEDAVPELKGRLAFLKEPFWEKKILGVLLYGSMATGQAGPGSDIDLSLVIPKESDAVRAELWGKFIGQLRDDRCDVRVFELLPLNIRAAVMEDGVVLHSRDELELYEYFHPIRREWEDQRHRQALTADEMRELIAAARRARAWKAGARS